MKTDRKPILVLFCVSLIVLTGCATQQTGSVQPETAQMPLKQRSVLVASAGDEAVSSEDEALLEDDPFKDELDNTDEADMYTVADPLEKLNRVTFYINDKLYFWLLKPVATGYRAVFPSEVRTGVSNFFTNLTAPVRLTNNILQGKGQAAEAELAKFLYNSTVGVLGFGNPAKDNPALNPDSEDMGQTLATYGVGDGFYLMLPLLGPSTLRDAVGAIGDRFLSPTAYVRPTEASMSLSAYNVVNKLSFRLGDYESLKKAALDPYEAWRNLYIQLRQQKIKH